MAILVKCKICSKGTMIIPSRIKSGRGKYCSRACRNKGVWTGRKHRPETIEKYKGKNNQFYGKKHTKEVKQKLSNIGKTKTGALSSNWQGGKSFEPYSIDWTSTLKRSIRERDRYNCQVCGDQQANEALSVHHMDYNKMNCNPTNLISLCRKCHTKTNFNRSYWLDFFKNKFHV